MNSHRLSIIANIVVCLFLVLPSSLCQYSSSSFPSQNVSLPSAPMPAPKTAAFSVTAHPNPVHFWTYRSSEQSPLRSNHEVFRSKLFDATHIGGAIAMAFACHSRNPGESCGSGAIVVGALFGMDYLQFRFVGGPNAIGAPIYEMIHYARVSTR